MEYYSLALRRPPVDRQRWIRGIQAPRRDRGLLAKRRSRRSALHLAVVQESERTNSAPPETVKRPTDSARPEPNRAFSPLPNHVQVEIHLWTGIRLYANRRSGCTAHHRFIRLLILKCRHDAIDTRRQTVKPIRATHVRTGGS